MASSLCVAPLRHIFTRQTTRLCPTQRRWAQVCDVRFRDPRFHSTQHTEERILSKYREQLEQKAKKEGHGSLDSLKEAYKEKIETLRKQAIVPGATGPLHTPVPEPAPKSYCPAHLPKGPSPPPPPPSVPKTTPAIKSLSAYLDLDKVSALSASEIPHIWRLRHADTPTSLSFSLPVDTFRTIETTARKHPQFVLPLPRDPIAQPQQVQDKIQETAPAAAPIEIHFLQFAWPAQDVVTLLFTHLAEYKLRGEYSSPHTTVTFHTELADSHGLVLGQGTVLEGRGVTVEEGRWLLMCLQKFYGAQAEETGRKGRQLLERFSSGDATFNVEELVDEAERL